MHLDLFLIEIVYFCKYDPMLQIQQMTIFSSLQSVKGSETVTGKMWNGGKVFGVFFITFQVYFMVDDLKNMLSFSLII